MSTSRQELKARMTVAATRRAAPNVPEAGKTAVRTKRVRITIDLDPGEYRALKRWIERTGETLDPEWPDLTQMRAVRAMIQAAVKDDVVNGVVVDLLRRDQT